MPLISVVLPVYNGADFIADAISSVLSQSYEDFELIVRDDRSTDGTRKIIDKFMDKRIIAIENETNLGLFGNFNACFEVSSGEFLHLFSQDDVMHPDCLKSQLVLLQKYKDAGMVYCGVRYIDESGSVLGDSSQDRTPEFLGRKLYLSLSAHYGSLAASVSTVMLRKDVLEAVGTFNPNMIAAGDCELWNRIADQYPIVRNRSIVADIRAHKNQVTNLNMTGLWYMREEIAMANWYRERLPAEDWRSIKAFRTRTRAVTYWAWICRQILNRRIGLAVDALRTMSKEYNPIKVFCFYCVSLNGRFFRPVARIKGD